MITEKNKNVKSNQNNCKHYNKYEVSRYPYTTVDNPEGSYTLIKIRIGCRDCNNTKISFIWKYRIVGDGNNWQKGTNNQISFLYSPTICERNDKNDTLRLYICEGEKDVDTLNNLIRNDNRDNEFAMCSPHGATNKIDTKKWNPAYTDYIINLANSTTTGTDIYIIPDLDKAGLAYGEVLYNHLEDAIFKLKDKKTIITVNFALPKHYDDLDIKDISDEVNKYYDSNDEYLINYINRLSGTKYKEIFKDIHDKRNIKVKEANTHNITFNSIKKRVSVSSSTKDSTTVENDENKQNNTNYSNINNNYGNDYISGYVDSSWYFNNVISAFNKYISIGTKDNQYMVLCPSHMDNKPSLAIDMKDCGCPSVYCNSGCGYEEVKQMMENQGIPVVNPDCKKHNYTAKKEQYEIKDITSSQLEDLIKKKATGKYQIKSAVVFNKQLSTIKKDTVEQKSYYSLLINWCSGYIQCWEDSDAFNLIKQLDCTQYEYKCDIEVFINNKGYVSLNNFIMLDKIDNKNLLMGTNSDSTTDSVSGINTDKQMHNKKYNKNINTSNTDIILRGIIELVNRERLIHGNGDKIKELLGIDVTAKSLGKIINNNIEELEQNNIKTTVQKTRTGVKYIFETITTQIINNPNNQTTRQDKSVIILVDDDVYNILQNSNFDKMDIVCRIHSTIEKEQKRLKELNIEYISFRFKDETKQIIIVSESIIAKSLYIQAYLKRLLLTFAENTNLDTIGNKKAIIPYLNDKFSMNLTEKNNYRQINNVLTVTFLATGECLDSIKHDIITRNITNENDIPDDIMAEYVLARLNQLWIQLHDAKFPYIYTGEYWVLDNEYKLTKHIITRCIKELRQLTNNKFIKSSARVERILKMLLNTADITTREEFNKLVEKNTHYITFKNGILDTNTLKMQDHTPDIFLTKCLDYKAINNNQIINYKEKAPHFYNYLNTVQGNTDIQKYLQKLAGACFTGEIWEKFWVFSGDGGNGKGTFTHILKLLLKDYALIPAARSLLLKGSSTQHPTVFAALEGKRVVVAEELDGDLDIATIKTLTGGDYISGRKMGEDAHEFKAEFKLIANTNTLPKIPADETAFWRRAIVIPWKAQIKKEDTKLKSEKLPGEIEYIAHWALEGLRLLREEGFDIPETIKEATQEWLEDTRSNDTIYQFIKECIEVVENGGNMISVNELYINYKQYMENQGKEDYAVKNIPAFSKKFGKYTKLESERMQINEIQQRYYLGIQFKKKSYLR